MTSVAAFVGNYRLFSYAMKAYGLEDMNYAKGLMTKVLQGGTTSSTALANTLTDKRYLAFAKAFDFAGQGTAATQATSATTGTTAKYVEQSLEDTKASRTRACSSRSTSPATRPRSPTSTGCSPTRTC